MQLSILVVTYNRREILAETLRRLSRSLVTESDVRLVIADDGSDDGTQAMVADAYPTALLVQSRRLGLGGNANAGLRTAFEHSDIVLQLQDDMFLTQPLTIDPHIRHLLDTPQDGYLRLWGVAGHRYTADLDGSYWRLRWDSPDLYLTSDRPHLKHRRFHVAAGAYPEGLDTAATEEAWCHQAKTAARERFVPQVVVPTDLMTESSWEHGGWGCRWRDKGL